MENSFKNELQEKTHKVKNPYDFAAPPYDRRCGRFVSAGPDHGVGKRQPVGHEGNPAERAECLPMKARMVNPDL